MEPHISTAGILEVSTDGCVTERDGALVIDFTATNEDVVIELNGERFSATSTERLAAEIRASRLASSGRPISIPYKVGVEGSRLVIGQAEGLADVPGAYLSGAAAQAAVEKAASIASSEAAWPPVPHSDVDAADLNALAAGTEWGGPLVVSMPRTGSTLMGMLFLFCRDASNRSGYHFDRYIHEPVAPMFWRGDGFESVEQLLDRPLSERDIVQESAYQFATPAIARWFLTQARSPVIFTMRHPQLAWPSRWRALLAQVLDANPTGPHADDYRDALEDSDFSRLGGYLTESVRPADNGFFAFMCLLDICVREGIDFVIVDNTRFRAAPEATMRTLCERLGISYDPGIVEWADLQAVLPRVVMTDLASGDEYRWYYERTLASSDGIQPETGTVVDRSRFPAQLRGTSEDFLTIDEAVTWYQLLLARPETLP